MAPISKSTDATTGPQLPDILGPEDREKLEAAYRVSHRPLNNPDEKEQNAAHHLEIIFALQSLQAALDLADTVIPAQNGYIGHVLQSSMIPLLDALHPFSPNNNVIVERFLRARSQKISNLFEVVSQELQETGRHSANNHLRNIDLNAFQSAMNKFDVKLSRPIYS